MLVASNFDTLIVHCVKDKLVVKGVPGVKYFLDDMVAINVFGKHLDVVL